MSDDQTPKTQASTPSADDRQTLHDLNNMFGAAKGSVQLMQMRHKDDAQSLRITDMALQSLENAQAYVLQKLVRADVRDTSGGISDSPERLAARHGVVESNDRHDLFFAAIEMTRMPMIVTDPNRPDNPIVFANQAFLNTTGYQMEEVLGRNCRFLQGEGTDPQMIANLSRAIRDRTDIAVEIQNFRKDGTAFWNALFVSPIFDRDGKLLYFFGSQLDVTRRREAEMALRRAQKMEAIGQLTGGIAHDFNNLLQVIIGNLQMARTVTEQPDKLNRYHEAVMQAAQKARVLTQQLLAFSRKQPLEARVVNLNRVVSELNDLLSRTLGSFIEIELDLDPDLANACIDTVQLEMALINILANARDAMPEGGRVTIRTANRSGPEGEQVELSVSDTGEGMPPEVLSRITEPFFTTKEVGKGTGLGLAQVYGFVKQSDGGFEVESTPGQGTTVHLYFPMVVGADDKAPAPERTSQTRGKGERVLLVEDNREVRELACAILEADGYEVVARENASAALDYLKGPDGVDLLFTDIVMPGKMNGVALAKEARQLFSDLPILITTGFADDVHGHTNAREFETIYKPYMPDELSTRVRGVLNRKDDHGA
ncbi:histidine kinase famiy protein [Asticcacaulis sp.]|uniref:histidine kinase famiy protein n=1 Tax=Asticcacaulis sp. TaxID=1872648 RepID=UPI00391CA40D